MRRSYRHEWWPGIVGHVRACTVIVVHVLSFFLEQIINIEHILGTGYNW